MSTAAKAAVSAALVEHGAVLRGTIAKQASATVLRFETPDDLFQGFATEALARSSSFEDRGEGSARAWLFEVARKFLLDRHRHWTTLKRGSGRVVRSGLGAGRSTALSTASSSDPSASQTGPGTIAARREQLVLAAKALALLLPRDRQLVEWSARDIPLSEMATRLGLSVDAVGKARTRALERLRKTHELVLRRMTASDG